MLKRLLACLVAAAAWPVAAQDITLQVRGSVAAIDGDTFRAGEVRIRLGMINAPERGETCCGQDATDTLARLLTGADTLDCDVLGTDHYGRLVATCRRGNEDDIAGIMVRLGKASAAPRFGADYVAAEAMARANGIGFWKCGVTAPESWRAAKAEVCDDE